ncbi:hypothetical protein SXCC_04739 [Gluconacetobacter sp. SXCC-1]|nr:hypothetical protein SXCC_04739 [Gluconacetobacter sp. SXCC-1]
MEYLSFQHRHRFCGHMRDMTCVSLLLRRCPVSARNHGAVRRFNPLQGQNAWRGENRCATLRG